MNARRPDPATIAFDALALDALRRTSRQDSASRDDAPTQLYVRARAPRSRSTLQTMTVRAVAALSHASSSARRVRRKVAQHDGHSHRAWAIALAAAGLLGGAAAALTATLITSAQPRRYAPPPRPASNAVPVPALTASPTPPTPVAVVPSTPLAAAPAAAPTPAPAVPPGRAPRGGLRTQRAASASTAGAVAALAAGDYRVALARYRELAAREPGQPAFTAIVHLLERDLARSCDPASVSPGSACER